MIKQKIPMMKLGFDFGSKNIHYAILAADALIGAGSIEHHGDLPQTLRRLTQTLFQCHPCESFASFGFTGQVGPIQATPIDPIIATVEANRLLKAGGRSLLIIGCESFYLIVTDDHFNYIRHIIHSDCASGTGSFIDQQAERIGFTTAQLADAACTYVGKVPAIASRCAVFAKSDIIHSPALGFSSAAIAAGICEGVARSVIDHVVKGRDLPEPILLLGGVSQNPRIAAAIRERLGKPVTVHPHAVRFGAIGAALLGQQPHLDLSQFTTGLKVTREIRDRLHIDLPEYPDRTADSTYVDEGVEIAIYEPMESDIPIYLGMDIGSTSTKMVVLGQDQTIRAGLYTRTKGDPVAAAVLLLKKLQALISARAPIKGVGTTGSGRQLVRQVLGADVSINEVLAHAYGAVALDPKVDTIIELGGQDAKFTLIRHGEVAHTAMNYICAAGTGSFIEEQAIRLGIALDEISLIADGQEAPFTSDRCTVYMERDLSTLLAEGFTRAQIITAVLYSVRDNYLSKVVGKAPMGERIYFQGATARNKALIAVFAEGLKKPIHVSKYCHLTGALGAAIHVGRQQPATSLFEFGTLDYQLESETCQICANRCQLSVYRRGAHGSAFGLKCGRRYDSKEAKKEEASQLERAYAEAFRAPLPLFDKAPTVGLPCSLYMEALLPLFCRFFARMGVNVVLSGTSRRIMDSGKAIACADFCAPMNLVHGQVKALIDQKVDFVFFPTIVSEQDILCRSTGAVGFIEKKSDCYFCYYSIYAPMVIKNLADNDFGRHIVTPLLDLNHATARELAATVADSLLGRLGRDRDTIIDHFMAAKQEHIAQKACWQRTAKTALSQDLSRVNVLLLGRPYVIFDPTLNQQIPAKIESLGVGVFHQSMFSLDRIDTRCLPGYITAHHWHYGQQILLTLEMTKKYDHLYPVFVTCFKCSPDAYGISYFKTRMQEIGKPYLILQLDELEGDVGYQTRIEAGLASFRHHFHQQRQWAPTHQGRTPNHGERSKAGRAGLNECIADALRPGDTIYMPYFGEITNRLYEMVYTAHGFRFMALKPDARMMAEGYRHASGGECMPNIAIMGMIFDAIRQPQFDAERSLFVCWTACIACNFPQFFPLIRMALNKAGYPDIRLRAYSCFAPDTGHPSRLMLDMITIQIISGCLIKVTSRLKAHEAHPGDTDRALQEAYDLLEEVFFRRRGILDSCGQFAGIAAFLMISQLPIDPNQQGLLARMAARVHPNRQVLRAAYKIRDLFTKVPLAPSPKPRIAVIGDLYVKWNPVVNQQIYSLVHELGGEIVTGSVTEYPLVAQYYDHKNGLGGSALFRQTRRFELSFEEAFGDLIGADSEPSQEMLDETARRYGIDHHIPGEIEINISRVLYMIQHGLCDAVLNLNPLLCCPGTTSTSLLRKISGDFNIPVIDIFYDGNNRPNEIVIPHLHYLKDSLRRKNASRR